MAPANALSGDYAEGSGDTRTNMRTGKAPKLGKTAAQFQRFRPTVYALDRALQEMLAAATDSKRVRSSIVPCRLPTAQRKRARRAVRIQYFPAPMQLGEQ